MCVSIAWGIPLIPAWEADAGDLSKFKTSLIYGRNTRTNRATKWVLDSKTNKTSNTVKQTHKIFSLKASYPKHLTNRKKSLRLRVKGACWVHSTSPSKEERNYMLFQKSKDWSGHKVSSKTAKATQGSSQNRKPNTQTSGKHLNRHFLQPFKWLVRGPEG